MALPSPQASGPLGSLFMGLGVLVFISVWIRRSKRTNSSQPPQASGSPRIEFDVHKVIYIHGDLEFATRKWCVFWGSLSFHIIY
jgi:hypothetical protein